MAVWRRPARRGSGRLPGAAGRGTEPGRQLRFQAPAPRSCSPVTGVSYGVGLPRRTFISPPASCFLISRQRVQLEGRACLQPDSHGCGLGAQMRLLPVIEEQEE